MSEQTFVVVGFLATEGPNCILAVGLFREQHEAEDYMRDVLAHQQFKCRFNWKAVPVSDPDVYRPRSGEVRA